MRNLFSNRVRNAWSNRKLLNIVTKDQCSGCQRRISSLRNLRQSRENNTVFSFTRFLLCSKAGATRSSEQVILLSCFSTMAPVNSDVSVKVDEAIKSNKVMVFSKSTCPFCRRVKELFQTLNVAYYALELDLIGDGPEIQEALHAKTGQRTVPNVFINSEHIGGCDKTILLHTENKLLPLLQSEKHSYEYDLIVIGGGSGGLAASKEAAVLGKKVAVCDFVTPSPMGTTWGLGGTCVNVGCIPKKLMHQAALLGEAVRDAKEYGWEFTDEAKHNWTTMITAIQGHIGSLNWGYKVALREKKVTYLNAYAEFVDAHTVKTKDKKGTEKIITAEKFIVCTGGRPHYPEIPGVREYCITSDDLFSLPYHPGKTLLVGASYIALECAGFLAGLGVDCTVMVRSILLRGFDQQMADFIGEYMENHGVKFIRECVPMKVEQISPGTPGKLKVTAKLNSGDIVTEEYNTVIYAVGRDACTSNIGLEKVGVQVNNKNGKILVNAKEETSVPHIHAIGDVIDGRLELTPVAIQAGKLLARRLYGGSSLLTDYINVPTTVFTPLEYGCVGLSEENAVDMYGEENIEVYHSNFLPLEWTVPHRENNICYAKLVCVKSDKDRVVGFHILGPNAGEITQGYAIGLKMGATKADFENLIGIHPTCAEVCAGVNALYDSVGDKIFWGECSSERLLRLISAAEPSDILVKGKL